MKIIKNFRPLYLDNNGTIFGSIGLKVYQSKLIGENLEIIGEYRGNFIQKMCNSFRILERISRSGFHFLLPLSDGSFIGVMRKWIVKLDKSKKSFQKVFFIENGSRPLNICMMPNGTLYWGEYFSNHNRDGVCIFGSNDNGNTWEKVYTFPAGTIRHVHNIIYDQYRNGCWVLTGDLDHECKILFTKDGFRSVDVIFEGSQQYRCVSLIPKKNYLLTGTDAPHATNYIQQLYVNKRYVKKVQKVDSSIFYIVSIGKITVMSTAIEPSDVNISKYATIWISEDDNNWFKLYQEEKDNWSIPPFSIIPKRFHGPNFFQHGLFIFPLYQNSEAELYAYAQATKENDGSCLYWSSSDLAEAFEGYY